MTLEAARNILESHNIQTRSIRHHLEALDHVAYSAGRWVTVKPSRTWLDTFIDFRRGGVRRVMSLTWTR